MVTAYRRRMLSEIEQRWGVVRLVRKELGISAFGAQVFELAPGMEGPAHDEAGTGQEELYVGLRGAGWIEIGDERVPIGADTYVFVRPEVHRQPVAGDDGLTYLCIGASPRDTYRTPKRFT